MAACKTGGESGWLEFSISPAPKAIAPPRRPIVKSRTDVRFASTAVTRYVASGPAPALLPNCRKALVNDLAGSPNRDGSLPLRGHRHYRCSELIGCDDWLSIVRKRNVALDKAGFSGR